MNEIRLAHDVVAQILSQARSNPDEECCGLVAGRDGEILQVFPARNVADRAAVAYEIAPKELFRIMREIRSARLELLGIYHSHPRGDNQPSPRDVERAYYPDATYFIISPHVAAPKPIRAYSIRDGHWAELKIDFQTE
jgi:proteasome lid subunit RPN8/RPN11